MNNKTYAAAVLSALTAVYAISYQAVTGQSSGQNSQRSGQSSQAPASTEWPTYGHDPGGMRFSPLKQITPANVSRLTVAWTYHMKPPADPNAVAAPAVPPPPGFDGISQDGASPDGRAGVGRDAIGNAAGGRGAAGNAGGGRGAARGADGGRGGRGGGNGFAMSEATPLVVGGMMYVSTPYQRVVALDPTTGKEIWAFRGQASTRGVEYWPGDAIHPAQIMFAGMGGLVALDAKTGNPAPAFGNNGIAAPTGGGGGFGGGASSPPIVYKNIIISGSANPNRDGRDGDVRGFDVVTGKELWVFHTIPQKGEFGYDTWQPGSAEVNTGARVWGLMTVDAERGIVYFPVKAPNWDRYGGDRHGDNLFSSSIVAVNATTGKYLWHFQIVHHDIWDFDPSAPPALFDVKKGGKTTPAVGLVSKSGLVFILDRLTGKPIYPIEERPVAASDIPEEEASRTQPFPTVTPPIARQTMSRADIAEVTPELYKYCTELIDKYNIGMGGPYNPPGYNHPTVNFPGTIGSANWGGMSFSPDLGYLFVNSHDLGQITGIGPRGGAREAIAVTGAGSGNNPRIPYDMVGLLGRFKSLDLNMLCNAPPWGSLTAVNVNTGLIVWRVPLGITESLPPDKQKTGRPNLGGTIVTAGGLVFVGATDDARFRAFDAKTGREIWTVNLPAAAHAVPSTYLGKDGKQYVVVTSTGGGFLQAPLLSDSIIAYALP